MPHRTTSLPFLLLLALLPCAPAGAQVAWETSLAAARTKAAAGKKPILVAVHLFDGKGAEEMVTDLLGRDGTKALAESVNVFVDLQLVKDSKPGKRPHARLPPALERADVAALNKLVDVPADRFLQGPQWILLTDEGKPIVAAPGRLTRGEVEWLVVQGVRKVRPDFPWQQSEGYRAPRQVVFDKVATTDAADRPTTDEEVAAIVEEMKKSRWPGRDSLRKFASLVRTSNPDAIDYVNSTTRANQFGQRPLLLAIAQWSPRVWCDLATELLERGGDGGGRGGPGADPGKGGGDGGDGGGAGGRGGRGGGRGGGGGGMFGGGGNVRTAAADALEELACSKTLPLIKKAWAGEKVEETQGAILRAMAASAPEDKAVTAIIDKELKAKSEALRAQATLAAGLLAQRDAVTSALAHGLQDRSALVRGAAAYTIAWRRDRNLEEALARAVADEKDAETKALLEAAVEALRGGALDPFDDFVRSKLGRHSLAELMQGDGGGGGRGRGGKGDGGEGKGGSEGGKGVGEGSGAGGKGGGRSGG